MAASIAAHILFRNLLLSRPLRLSTTSQFSLLHPKPKLSFSHLSLRPLHDAVSIPHCSDSATALQHVSEERDSEFDDLEERERGGIGNNDGLTVVQQYRNVPNLSVKEKKELCSYANSLGDKLKSQQVGKSGVTDNVFFALSETLEKNELLKLKIHKTCPGEMDDLIKQLEQGTGSVAVGQIGRTVIFYRPSLTRMKAEERKEQARKLALKRQKARTAFMMSRNREQSPRRPGRGPPGYRRSAKVPS